LVKIDDADDDEPWAVERITALVRSHGKQRIL
jgi:hypothetical protein